MTSQQHGSETGPETVTSICTGTTKGGSRCRRKALPGSPYCSQHASQGSAAEGPEPTAGALDDDGSIAPAARARARRGSMPRDIDRGELNDVINTLGNGRRFGDTSGSPVSSALDDLASVLHFITGNMGRIRDMAINNGIVDSARAEGFITDLATAVASATTALTERLGGEYEEDDFGFDARFTEGLAPLLGLMYKYYWRVDVDGITNVPASGRALLVSNHAGGGLPFDGAMVRLAIHREHPQPRHARMTVLDWAMGMPWLGDFMKKTGQVLANSANAIELLNRDEIVGVFPEGVKGMGKPFSQRYNLERFGRGGFVRIALRTGSPIIPVAVVGSEEIYPKLGNLPLVNKLIGAPFVPITPLFPLFGLAGLMPLPSKWHIEFCEPIDVSKYPPEAAEDRSFVLELSEQVRATIQKRLRANLLKRHTPFW